jgi:hypothetical protein
MNENEKSLKRNTEKPAVRGKQIMRHRMCVDENTDEGGFINTKNASNSKQRREEVSDSNPYLMDNTRNTKHKKSQRKTIEEYQSNSECSKCNEYADPSELVISASPNAYLMLPNSDFISGANHLLLCPRDHVTSSLQADPNTRDELRNYKKCVIKHNAKCNMGTIFIEFYDSTRNSHFNSGERPH